MMKFDHFKRICRHFPLIFRHGRGNRESSCHLPCTKSPEKKYIYDNDDHDDVDDVDDDPNDGEDLGRRDVVKSGHPFVPVEVVPHPARAGNLLEQLNN